MNRKGLLVVASLLGLAFIGNPAGTQTPASGASHPSPTWRFEHRVLQDYFTDPDAMNGECAIVDVDGDGHPDLWWSCYAFLRQKAAYARQKDLYQMAWYQGPEFTRMVRMHKGVTHGGNWCDLNGDGRPDIIGSNWNNRLKEYPLKAELWINRIGQKLAK